MSNALVMLLDVEPMEATKPPGPRWRPIAAVAGAVVLIAAVGLTAQTLDRSPQASIDIFDEPQDAQDLAVPELQSPGVDKSSVRFLGTANGWDFYAYRQFENFDGETHDGVCMFAFTHAGGATGVCGSVEDFNRNGMATGVIEGPSESGTLIIPTVQASWGPTGGLRVVEGSREVFTPEDALPPLQTFDRDQTDKDHSGLDYLPDLTTDAASTVRFVDDMQGFELFAYQPAGDTVCLIAVDPGSIINSAAPSCTTVNEFHTGGISASSPAGAGNGRAIVFTWGPGSQVSARLQRN